MADSNKSCVSNPNQTLAKLDQILLEAQSRWLRPPEICEVLRNHDKFHLATNPPLQPPAGSLYLFDRKVLRYFRRDGHRWRKKKDGKTVKEAHEKLKAGSVDVLHCYYAHGEDNENFQRRSYWMLDERLENIVLVHYRDVKEGSSLGVHRLINADSEPQLQSPSTPSLEQTHSSETKSQTSYGSYPSAVDWSGKTLSPEFEDGDSRAPEISPHVQPLQLTLEHPPIHADETIGFPGATFSGAMGLSTWPGSHGFNRNMSSLVKQESDFDPVSAADSFLSHKLTDARLDGDYFAQEVASFGDWLNPDYGSSEVKVSSDSNVQNNCQRDGGTGELKKLDSFGRWMDKEMGGDCDDSLMASVSGQYWSTFDANNEDKEVSSLSTQIQLESDLLAPSLSQQQLFTISDFAPDSANSEVSTKVLIVGSFLGDKQQFKANRWCCMFGEVEVAAEVLSENIIRCQAPSHAPGCVPFYITCGNRLACSEVREFKFCEIPSLVSSSSAFRSTPEDELRSLIRLSKLLLSGLDKKYLYCSVEECDKCMVKNAICSLKNESKNSWGRVDEAIKVFDRDLKDVLIQNLLKDKLYEWLVCRKHEAVRGLNILDGEGQGVIHLAAALGFEWALGPIVAAGVNPNFRDVQGRTALHWASIHGREEAVIVLLRLGASAGAVDDPTPAFPGGQKAADLASSRGHKGIAGYLAEADLNDHLSSLSVKGNVNDNAAAITESPSEIAIEYDYPSKGDEDRSLKWSLAAVRRSARAAALIQDDLRVRSFRHRQMTKSVNDLSEAPVDLVALGHLNKVQKMNHFDDYLHSAAVKIQQKYRGCKARQNFLSVREHIVKIQAHVRGHQVRKQYKKVVWSVSIVEKAILRWRRKKPGLRGLQTKTSTESLGAEVEKKDEYDFLRIGRQQKRAGVEKAFARVQSMARHPEAREQYMRMLAKFEALEVNEEVAQQANSSEEVNIAGT